MRKTAFILGFLILFALGGFAFYFWPRFLFNVPAQVAANDVDLSQVVSTSTPPTTVVGQGKRQYANSVYHFKIDFPDSLAVTEYKEANNAITVTFANADNSQSFEVYVTPYNKTQIDQVRFKLDEPSGTFLQPQNVLVGGTPATMFYGHNGIMGDTREVWFIRNGYLYEVATYKDLDAWLGTIMQSWEFI